MTDKLSPGKENLVSIRKGYKEIDALINRAWELRYENPEYTEITGQSVAKQSNKSGDQLGLVYGKLLQGVGRYLHTFDEQVASLLLDAKEQLENLQGEKTGWSVCYNFLAMVFESSGDYGTAFEHANKAVQYAREASFSEGEGDALVTIGQIHSRLCDFRQAMDSYRASLEIRTALGNNKAMASSLNLIARACTLTGEFDQAESYYQQSLALRKKINDVKGLPWTYLGIASLEEERGSYPEAIRAYHESIKANQEIGEKRSSLQCLIGLGRIHTRLGKFFKAEEYLAEAMEIADAMNVKPLLSDVHRSLGSLYEATGDLKNALHHYKEFQRIDNEVNSTETQSKLRNQQIIFATQQSRKEAEIFQLRNVELKQAYDNLEEKNNEITDSIRYAQKLQAAVLPLNQTMDEILGDYFLLYLPKDIVSGDFYWAAEKNGMRIFTAADCTGHGIPGAFMSMLGISFLNEIVSRMRNIDAGRILDQLREKVISSLHQSGEEGTAKDGMDMALCVYDDKENKLQFAGAFNSLYLFRDGELTEYKADRMPVSVHQKAGNPFTTQDIKIYEKDIIYLFSDGFADQFGGEQGKKYMYRRFREFISSINHLGMKEQKQLLEKEFMDWKRDYPQVDDVIVLGVKF